MSSPDKLAKFTPARMPNVTPYVLLALWADAVSVNTAQTAANNNFFIA